MSKTKQSPKDVEITVKQAAELLGVSKARVEQYLREDPPRLVARVLEPTGVRVIRRSDVMALQRNSPGRPKTTA